MRFRRGGRSPSGRDRRGEPVGSSCFPLPPSRPSGIANGKSAPTHTAPKAVGLSAASRFAALEKTRHARQRRTTRSPNPHELFKKKIPKSSSEPSGIERIRHRHDSVKAIRTPPGIRSAARRKPRAAVRRHLPGASFGQSCRQVLLSGHESDGTKGPASALRFFLSIRVYESRFHGS